MAPYIGEIRIFGGNFAPAGWAFCNGQLMPISENDALFNLIGTTYGGDGQETFALPDLRGRVPVHMGTGSDGINYLIGEMGGTEEVTLTVQQIPNHSHKLKGAGLLAMGSVKGNSSNPTSRYPAMVPGTNLYSTTIKDGLFMEDPNVANPSSILSPSGGSQPHNNMQPYLAVNFIISLYGIFPSQT